MFKYIFALVLVIGSSLAGPQFFERCSHNDKICIKQQAQQSVPAVVKGIPELNVKTMEPLHIDRTSVNLPDFKMTLTDINVKGYKNVIIDDINIDWNRKRLTLVFTSDYRLISKYNVNGRIAILPIKGEGKSELYAKQLKVKTVIDLNIVERNGNKYVEFGEKKVSFDVQGGAKFKFENLFNGNKALAEPVLAFMNENWQLVISTIGKDILQNVFNAAVDNLTNMFRLLPFDEMFTDF